MDAGELDESEEVFDVVFPSGDETAEVVHPGEEALDLPAFLVAAQLAWVLRLAPVATVRRDQLNAILVGKSLVQLVRIVRLVDWFQGAGNDCLSGETVFREHVQGSLDWVKWRSRA